MFGLAHGAGSPACQMTVRENIEVLSVEPIRFSLRKQRGAQIL
jgi:hypothetical protein